MKTSTIKEIADNIESITEEPAFEWSFISWKIQLTKWLTAWQKAIRSEAFDAAIERIKKGIYKEENITNDWRGGHVKGIEWSIKAIEELIDKEGEKD